MNRTLNTRPKADGEIASMTVTSQSAFEIAVEGLIVLLARHLSRDLASVGQSEVLQRSEQASLPQIAGEVIDESKLL